MYHLFCSTGVWQAAHPNNNLSSTVGAVACQKRLRLAITAYSAHDSVHDVVKYDAKVGYLVTVMLVYIQ